MKKKNFIKLLLVFLAVVLVSSTLFFILFSYVFIIDIKSMKYNFKIEQGVLGLNGDPDYLGFGKIPPGGASEKKVTISCSQRCFVSIKIRGEKSDYITVDKNNFVLENGNETITFYASIPKDENEEGSYNGTVTFLFFKMP